MAKGMDLSEILGVLVFGGGEGNVPVGGLSGS